LADNPRNILGYNSANNLYSSTAVTANADGSMIERQEYMQGLLAGLTVGDILLQGTVDAAASSTTIIPVAGLAGYGNDFFNNQFYLQVLKNANSAGNAPEKQVRMITDYATATGTFTCDAFSSAVEASDVVLILHESQVAIGRDDNNNTYASSNVAANENGSVLERLEAIKDQITAVDDFVDTEVAAIKAVTDVIPDAGALTTISGKIDAIDNYIDEANLEKLTAKADGGTHAYPDSVADDSVVAYLASKADPADMTSYNNTTDSLEALSDKIDTIDDYIDGANLEKLTSAADGGSHAYPDSVAQESVIAYLMSKSANPVTTSFDNQTDSLEAISDAVSGLNDVSTAEVNTEVDNALNTIVPASPTAGSINDILSKAAGGNTFDKATDSLEAISDKVGTPVNAGGTATVGAILGDFANVSLASRLGLADGTTTESIQGKLGTDTELADRSLYDILNGGGPAAAAAAAAPANDKSLYAVASAIYNLSVPAAATGETVIDEGDYDWTADYPALLTIAPAAGSALADVVVHLDMDKVTTGFATIYGAQTLSVYVERKIDGTNWRRELIVETALAGTGADVRDMKINVGDIGITQQARITAALSAEVSGTAETEIPYVVYYKGLAAPTITPLAATP